MYIIKLGFIILVFKYMGCEIYQDSNVFNACRNAETAFVEMRSVPIEEGASCFFWNLNNYSYTAEHCLNPEINPSGFGDNVARVNSNNSYESLLNNSRETSAENTTCFTKTDKDIFTSVVTANNGTEIVIGYPKKYYKEKPYDHSGAPLFCSDGKTYIMSGTSRPSDIYHKYRVMYLPNP